MMRPCTPLAKPAWSRVLHGYKPFLALEITKSCPLHCSGCYAFHPNHVKGSLGLRELAEFRGQQLVDRVLDLVRRLHIRHTKSAMTSAPLDIAKAAGCRTSALASANDGRRHPGHRNTDGFPWKPKCTHHFRLMQRTDRHVGRVVPGSNGRVVPALIDVRQASNPSTNAGTTEELKCGIGV